MHPFNNSNFRVSHRSGRRSGYLLVHGGPGLRSSYLEAWIAEAAPGSPIVSYDQHGSTAETDDDLKDVDITSLVTQFLAMHERACAELSTPPRVFAHSWGTWLVLEAQRRAQLAVRMVLCNPMPLTWQGFQDAATRLVSRVDPALLPRIEELESEATLEAGALEMRLLLPAYLSPRAKLARPLNFETYSPKANSHILALIEGYDHRAAFADNADRCTAIFGADDHFLPTEFRTVPGADLRTVRGAGHFPFAEQSRQFAKMLSSLRP